MISEREAVQASAPIVEAEQQTLADAERTLEGVARKYEIRRDDTQAEAEQKSRLVTGAIAGALLVYLLSRRRASSQTGVEFARRNMRRAGLSQRIIDASIARTLAVPIARSAMLLERAVTSLAYRIGRNMLARIPSAAARPPSVVVTTQIPRRPVAAPGERVPSDAVGAVRKATEQAKPGLERIVQVETWEESNASSARAQRVAAEYAPGLVLEWVAFLDRRTCPTCRALDGQVVEARVGFDILPPVHPYCRCMTILRER